MNKDIKKNKEINTVCLKEQKDNQYYITPICDKAFIALREGADGNGIVCNVPGFVIERLTA